MSDNNEQKLVLYMLPGSYFSQISLLALLEKELSFETHFVNIYRYEHCEPWFLKLNPKSEIPVLQHGEKLIPGSDQIFFYLDEKFCNNGVPRLIPSKGTEALRKMEKFSELFGKIRSAVITYGVIRFPELTTGHSIPVYEQEKRISFLQNKDKFIQDVLNRFPEVSELASEKRTRCEDLINKYQNIEEVVKEIDSVAAILDQVEDELASHNGAKADWWLCCEQFTSADVLLTIILHRIELLGLSSSLLLPDKIPCVVAYKAKIEKKPAFQAFLLHLARLHKELESYFQKNQ